MIGGVKLSAEKWASCSDYNDRFFIFVDKRFSCFLAQQAFVDTGGIGGFPEKCHCLPVQNPGCISKFGDQRDFPLFFIAFNNGPALLRKPSTRA